MRIEFDLLHRHQNLILRVCQANLMFFSLRLDGLNMTQFEDPFLYQVYVCNLLIFLVKMIALLKSDFTEIVAVTQRYSSGCIFEEVLLKKLHLLFDLVQLCVLQKRLIIGSTQDGQLDVGFRNAGCRSRLIPNKSQLAKHFAL